MSVVEFCSWATVLRIAYCVYEVVKPRRIPWTPGVVASVRETRIAEGLNNFSRSVITSSIVSWLADDLAFDVLEITLARVSL